MPDDNVNPLSQDPRDKGIRLQRECSEVKFADRRRDGKKGGRPVAFRSTT